MTVLTEIPLEFESYLRDKTLQKLPTNLNEFIFAYIPNLDLSVDIDRNSTIPDENLIVHKAQVASIGKTGDNAIVYSAIIDSTVAEFTFNAIYLHDKNEANACGMIIHQQDETKQHAMTITKSALMQYDSAAASANVTVDAETWQVDISDLFAACSKVGHTHTLAEVGGSNPNMLINGCFSINQRYAHNQWIDAVEGSVGYFADRWVVRSIHRVGGVIQYKTDQNGGTAAIQGGGSRMSAKFAGAESFWSLHQRVEMIGYDMQDILGKDLTISFRMYSSEKIRVKAGCVFLTTADGPATNVSDGSFSDYFFVSGMQDCSVTVRMPDSLYKGVLMNDLILQIYIEVAGVSSAAVPDTIVEFYYAKAELGSVATKFIPDDMSCNTLKCQRYYQNSTGKNFPLNTNSDGTGRGMFVMFNSASNGWYRSLHSGQTNFKVTMRSVPTMRFADTKGNIGKLTNVHIASNIAPLAGSPVSLVSEQGFVPDVKLSPESGYAFQWEADAEI